MEASKKEEEDVVETRVAQKVKTEIPAVQKNPEEEQKAAAPE